MNNDTSEARCGIGFYKIVSIILIATVLILIVSFAVSGSKDDPLDYGDNSGDSMGNTNADADKPNGDTVINGGTADNINTDKNQVNSDPKYYYYLSGMQCTAEQYAKQPIVFVSDPSAPTYGISSSEIVVEMPTENGESRFMIFNRDISNFGKIGAFSPTRDYMSQIIKFFGGILISDGNDDIVNYDHLPQSLHLDLSANKEYVYMENGKNLYSDSESLAAFIKNENIDLTSPVITKLPFIFKSTDDLVKGHSAATNVVIPYGDDSKSELIYDNDNDCYIMSKDGRYKIDMLTGKNATFKNVFVLFSDMITYELASGTETVVNTATCGTGYYVTCGTLIEIKWAVNQAGELNFYDLDGNQLIVNRGNSYISYYKSSAKDDVTYS